MRIHIIRQLATQTQIGEMLEELKAYIKLAVDVERGILAGGGEYRADCEKVLLEDGSRQDSIWGANWRPEARVVEFEAIINIRPRLGNTSMLVRSPLLRGQIEAIVRRLLERAHP
jgi:hypothetical protein